MNLFLFSFLEYFRTLAEFLSIPVRRVLKSEMKLMDSGQNLSEAPPPDKLSFLLFFSFSDDRKRVTEHGFQKSLTFCQKRADPVLDSVEMTGTYRTGSL